MVSSRRPDISAIALTHAHPDHPGTMKRLAAQFEVPVWWAQLRAFIRQLPPSESRISSSRR
jgi:glyoxylase-like metal-dependent hydrolase (beta-lactamase superfamily II)